MPIDIADPAKLPKDFSIFFCWQDHLDKKLHRFLIRDALNAAIGKIQGELPEDVECILRQDSDTMNRAGSVDIANSILEKINNSAVVIGDVTPVLCDSAKGFFYPNPNVLIELGYAAKHLGWNRVVCLFNEAVCSPKDLPFDISHRRLTPYCCKDISQKAQATKALEGILCISIRAILQEIGRGEFDATLGNETVKRQRDLRLLRQLMSAIHRPSLDTFIECGMRYQLDDRCNLFFFDYEAVVCSSTFRFHDKELERLAFELHKVWGAAITHAGLAFFPSNRPGAYVLKEDHLWNKDYRQTVERMIASYKQLPVVLNAFLSRVHTNYSEIDMKETDAMAWKAMLPYLNERMEAEKAGKKSGASRK